MICELNRKNKQYEKLDQLIQNNSMRAGMVKEAELKIKQQQKEIKKKKLEKLVQKVKQLLYLIWFQDISYTKVWQFEVLIKSWCSTRTSRASRCSTSWRRVFSRT